MKNKGNNDLSRLEFLKASGLLASGMTLLPGIARAMLAKDLQDASGLAINYAIIIPLQADKEEKQAAKELHKYLTQISGISAPVLEEGKTVPGKAIYLGKTAYAKKSGVDLSKVQEGGYLFKPVGSNLIIAGGAKRGVLFGVYDLLESLGFKKYAPDYTAVPQVQTLAFTGSQQVFAPQISYRTTSYGSMGGEDYTDWHKLSSRSDWGLFVHTFHTLVPAKDYGESHPEYFSLIKGKRLPGTQLCLSNQEVADVLIANLKKKIAEKPEATYWSVSQDDNDQYCSCDNCKALNEKYGGVPSGSIIYFVNKVAKAIPDKKISTLAYWYSRKAPKNIAIEPNVNIMLCNIESLRQAPVYVTDPAFSNDLKEWGALSKDILIWDYNIQFTNFFAPFPNIYTIKPNIKFYTDNHVNALFMQANNEPAAEMALLRGYLISKLMWDPQADEKLIIDEFLHGYYGAAGKYIRTYIDSMQDSLVMSGFKLNIFGDPIDAKETFLSASMITVYKGLFDQAEAAVRADASLLERVRVARLPIMYAEIQIGRTEIDTARSLYRRDSGGIVRAKPEMKALVSRFVEGCKRKDVKLIRERSGSPDHFQASYNRIFREMEQTPGVKSFGKTINPVSAPAKKSKGVEALTDGIFASYEAWQQADENWVFYTGEHMDFVLDLGAIIAVNSINMDFLNPQAQPDWHLLALPKEVSYALSADGEKYEPAVQVVNPHNPNPIQNPEISKLPIYSFMAKLPAGTQARYIKVHAENLLKMPSWHIRAGQPVSIYTDQIVVI